MINKLQRFFEQHLKTPVTDTADLAHRVQLASAALMVEVMYADEQVIHIEKKTIRHLLEERFNLSTSETTALLDLAEDEKHDATDYYAFTSLLNQHCSQEEKIKLIEDLWRIAYSDDELDKHEEHLVRRLADLLHVPHHQFIRSKLNVAEKQ